MKMKIHREGKNILLILFIILALLNLPVYLWIKITWLAYLIHAVSIIFFFLVVNFFRSPKRHFKGNPKNAIVAPADGVVVVLEEVLEDEYFHEQTYASFYLYEYIQRTCQLGFPLPEK